MPAPGQTVAEGLPDRILSHLAEHADEQFRPAELARILLPDWSKSDGTMRVGTTLARLARTGRVGVHRESVEGRKVPITTYSHHPSS